MFTKKPANEFFEANDVFSFPLLTYKTSNPLHHPKHTHTASKAHAYFIHELRRSARKTEGCAATRAAAHGHAPPTEVCTQQPTKRY